MTTATTEKMTMVMMMMMMMTMIGRVKVATHCERPARNTLTAPRQGGQGWLDDGVDALQGRLEQRALYVE